jgi:peroxiredoxin/uncharacterized membrane protein YphA (DoxX/SURF4 family)
MNTVLVVARVGLALVFALAAVTKLADMRGSRAALEGFRVPAPLIPAGAIALPICELAAAVMLVLAPTAGAALAIVLLLAFIGGIAAALRRGAAPDCHCFGQLHSKPAGTETLVRNGLLAAAAAVVLIGGPGPAIDSWAQTSSGNLVALAATSLLAIVLAYVCYSQWSDNPRRQRSTASAELVAVSPGEPLPSFEVSDAAGVSLSSADLLAEAPRSVLVFTSATCGPCLALLPELARWRRQLTGRVAIHVVSAGDAAKSRSLAEEHDLAVRLDPGSDAAKAVGVSATPSALAVDETGRVMAPMAIGAPSIEGLIRVVLKRPSQEELVGMAHQAVSVPDA